MKKFSLLLASLFCVFLFAGCGGQSLAVKELGTSPVAMQTVTIPDPYRSAMSYQLSIPEDWSCGTPTSHQIIAGFQDIADRSDFAGDLQSYVRIASYMDGAHAGAKSAHEKLFKGDTQGFEKWLNEDSAKESEIQYRGTYSDVQCTNVYQGTNGKIYEVEYWNTYQDSKGSSGYRILSYYRDDSPYYVMVTLGSSRTNDVPQTERPFRAQDVALWVADSFEVQVAD